MPDGVLVAPSGIYVYDSRRHNPRPAHTLETTLAELKLYGGYLIRDHEVIFDPANPEAEWFIVADAGQFSLRQACLARQVPEGWEVIYSRYHHGFVLATAPPDAATIQNLEPVIQTLFYAPREFRWLLKDTPILARNTTGDPWLAGPKHKCCKCQGKALVKLCAYSTSGTTSRVVRYFCKKCLRKGKKVGNPKLICHICRKPGADKQVWWVAHPEGKGPYEFRVHNNCVTNLDNFTCEPPTLEERRPLQRVIVKSEPETPSPTAGAEPPQC